MASDAIREALVLLRSMVIAKEPMSDQATQKYLAAIAALDAAQPQQDAYQNAVMMLRKLAYNPIRFTKEEIRDALCRWGLQGNILRDNAARARQERA